MSKELEALEYLKNRISTLALNHKIGNKDIANLEVKDIVMGIETYVTPIFEQALTKLEQQAKEFEELKQTNSLVKENIDNILSRMLTYDDVSDLTLSFVEDIQNELDKLLGEEDE